MPGARSIALRQLRDRLTEVPANQPVAVICLSGHRSAQGAEVLAAAGIDAVTVEGGTAAWTKAGLSLEG